MKNHNHNHNDTLDAHREAILQVGDGKVGREISHMLMAGYKILYIRSSEEYRVLNTLKHISVFHGYRLYQWDCSRGLLQWHCGDSDNKDKLEPVTGLETEANEHATACLSYIIDLSKSDSIQKQEKKVGPKGRIFVFLDMHNILDRENYVLERRFREFTELDSATVIIIIAPVFVCPASLDKDFTLIDFPLPSKQEIASLLDQIVADIPDSYPAALDAARDHKEDIIDAARGLTLVEAANAYAKTLAKNQTFVISNILEEKRQIIRKSGILEYLDPTITFKEIGGLDALREWLQTRRLSFSEDARAFGCPIGRGVLLLGIPGTGKSAVCSALGDMYQMPLLRLDMGAIYGSFVGESEKNIRTAIQVAEAVSPAVLWLDEIEKGISGATAIETHGTSGRVFGTFLTWLQEKTCAVFVAATANNIRGIPPEFLRAGRFDEIFFLDLPNDEQRRDVIGKLLTKKKRDSTEFDIVYIAEKTANYSPAEIEKGIDNALFVAYMDNKRKLTTEDVIAEMGKFQPLYNGRRDDIEDMRQQALGENNRGGLARLANSTQAIVGGQSLRRSIHMQNEL